MRIEIIVLELEGALATGTLSTNQEWSAAVHPNMQSIFRILQENDYVPVTVFPALCSLGAFSTFQEMIQRSPKLAQLVPNMQDATFRYDGWSTTINLPQADGLGWGAQRHWEPLVLQYRRCYNITESHIGFVRIAW